MNMFLIRNILLVKVVHLDLFFAMRCSKQEQEVSLELVAVVVDKLLRVFPNQQHPPNMRLGLSVHLETIFVPALLFANLVYRQYPEWQYAPPW